MNGLSIATAPLLPWWAIAGIGGLALVILAFGLWRRARGVWWRGLAMAIVLVAIADPSLVEEQRQPQKDVAVIVADTSLSQHVGDRQAVTAAAVKRLTDQLGAYADLDVRVIDAGAQPPGAIDDRGTELFGPLGRALAEIPPQRLAGVALVTDGQVHDTPTAEQLGITAPLHVVLSGKHGERDRRLLIEQAPSFGIVGKELDLTLKVEDLGGDHKGPAGTAKVTIRRDGGEPRVIDVPIGQDTHVPVTLDHGGPTVFEMSVEPGPYVLTPDNKRAAIVVNGVRDRLKVLLVSGEPHAGERTWRNILKADPSVDLVHFTILRPPEKQDGTPIRELSLIAFPIRELFDVKLDEFDLIIFDRYNRRGVLPQTYFDNIARFVRKGGALLEAAGPSFGTAMTLYRTPLGSVLPAEPTGQVFEAPFKPKVTALGDRHPVTADLPGGTADPTAEPSWGRWFRTVEADPHKGNTVMSGYNGAPLLVLDRVGEGRVAQLLSDEMWLWTRGFEGGGPQAELLRRLVYWLMKEPDLEENDLRGSVDGDRLTITRHSLQAGGPPVQLTRPNGRTETVPLAEAGGGREVAVVPVTDSGLYRITDGTRTALAAAGALNPLELSDVRTTDEKLAPLVKATGGGIVWAGEGTLPDARRVRPDRDAAGRGWIGFRANGDYTVTGVKEVPLLPGWVALLVALGALLLAWRREGR
ncbi:MAG TPA: hypothetical protein VNT30_22545 [Stellaceae bacterium]|nr:hypothetical protein [Stellaceae bacterium]